MNTPNTRIPAFFLGGVVPQDRVGLVMEALYLADAKEMQIDPVFAEHGIEPAPRVAKIVKDAETLPKPKAPAADKSTTTVTGMALNIVEAAKGLPVHRQAIIAAIEKAGLKGAKNVSTPLAGLVKRGLITRVGQALYAAAGSTVSPQREGTVTAQVIAAIKTSPVPVTRRWIRLRFGIQNNSLGPMVRRLVDRGIIKQVGHDKHGELLFQAA